ncbi:ATP-binding protein, partial [Kaistella sp. SH19-2b]
WNEGELPENWTVAKLKIKHPSRPYNPEIANAFFRSGLIESWGRGTIKIFNEAKAAKIPVPIFRYEDNGFYVIFNFVEISIQQQVLDLIKEDPKMTVVKISELLSVNSRTILRTFKALQENSIIERLGNNRTGEWRIL